MYVRLTLVMLLGTSPLTLVQAAQQYHGSGASAPASSGASSSSYHEPASYGYTPSYSSPSYSSSSHSYSSPSHAPSGFSSPWRAISPRSPAAPSPSSSSTPSSSQSSSSFSSSSPAQSPSAEPSHLSGPSWVYTLPKTGTGHIIATLHTATSTGRTLPPPPSLMRAPASEHHRDVREQSPQAQEKRHPDREVSRQQRAQAEQRDAGRHTHDRRPGSQPPQAEPLRANASRGISSESIHQQSVLPARFASYFMHHDHPEHWRADRIEEHRAWRRHHHAAFVAWTGPLFWPYVYTDLLYYPFWPDAYDDAYWSDAYDDFLDGIYWVVDPSVQDDGADEEAELDDPEQEPSHGRRQVRSMGAGICGSDSGIIAWPLARIESAIKPTAEQRVLLDQLEAAAARAANGLKVSCPGDAALTPTGRVQAMLDKLEAAVNASHTVHAPLMTLFDSLSDEQKVRFDAFGPDAGPRAGAAGPSPSGSAEEMCSGQMRELTELPIERIASVVHPSDAQQPKLDELRKASDHAVAILQTACPNRIPRTPVDRLDAIESRLDAMIRAAKTVQPALKDFYGALTDEQKARMKALGPPPRGDG
jgi:LTXXQ motif family protein